MLIDTGELQREIKRVVKEKLGDEEGHPVIYQELNALDKRLDRGTFNLTEYVRTLESENLTIIAGALILDTIWRRLTEEMSIRNSCLPAAVANVGLPLSVVEQPDVVVDLLRQLGVSADEVH